MKKLLLSFTLLPLFLFIVCPAFAQQPVGSWERLGLDNRQVRTLVDDPIDPNVLYAGTDNGIYKSTDGGSNWTGILNEGSNSFLLSIAPSDHNVLYASVGNGIQKTVDGGVTWIDLHNNFGPDGSIMDIVVSPTNANTVYVSMYHNCQWKTTDGGVSWSVMQCFSETYRLILDPLSSNTLYTGGAFGGQLYKTTDAGSTWSNTGNAGLGNVGAIRGIAIDYINTNTIYAGVETSGIYKSIDAGANWTFLPNSPSINVDSGVSTDPVRLSTVYSKSPSGVSRSTDGGSTWTDISVGQAPLGSSIARLMVFPNNLSVLYATTSMGIYAYGLAPISTPTPTPTSIPTPTSVPTVTSTPAVSILNVPLLKQTSNPWQSQTYDSANLWSSANPTINRWGCAMTSATMVFTYHGINKLPDGTILDPGSLNKWLKSQKDGYIREGWVNWLALSRLSKLAKNINGLSFDALEYKRVNGPDKAQLTTDIHNSIPDILEQSGHYVVAKGIQNNTFSINDPFYNRPTLNDGYSNTFLSLGRFVPSHTDLSYVMLVTDPDISLKILDSEGNEVATGFIQQPINDPTGNGKHNTAVTMLYFEQPASEEYELIASSVSSKTFALSSFLYDVNGNVSSVNQQGIATSTSTSSFVINFDQNNANNSKVSKDATFQSTVVDIKQLEKLHLINHGVANSLIVLIKESRKEFEKGKEKNALRLIDVAIKIINTSNKKLVDEKAYQVLLQNFKSLKKLVNN